MRFIVSLSRSLLGILTKWSFNLSSSERCLLHGQLMASYALQPSLLTSTEPIYFFGTGRISEGIDTTMCFNS